jgi:predicted transcriptional regulator
MTVQVRVLLSIKPEYATKIFDGEKQVEYRRRPIRNADKVIVYVTKPVGKVLGEFEVDDILCAAPEDLWERTSHRGGISKQAYFEYFKDTHQAFALEIKNVKRYEQERELKDYGLKMAPQFFVMSKKTSAMGGKIMRCKERLLKLEG